MTHRSPYKYSFGLTLFLLLAWSCDNFKYRGDVNNTNYVAAESFLFAVKADTQQAIRLEAVNGTVLLKGRSHADSIRVEGEKRVGSESTQDAADYLTRLQVALYEQPDYLLVRTEQPGDNRGRLLEVDYVITFPDSLNLDLSTVNGNITLDSLRANLAITHVNGTITLQRVEGNVAVSVVNGSVIGDISIPAEGLISHSVVNGNIDLTIPDTTSAQLAAVITNGPISWTGLNPVDMEQTATRFTATLGNGNGKISLQTVNGTIQITGRK